MLCNQQNFDSRELLHSAFTETNYTLTIKIILHNSITSEILHKNHFHFAHKYLSDSQICNSNAEINGRHRMA